MGLTGGGRRLRGDESYPIEWGKTPLKKEKENRLVRVVWPLGPDAKKKKEKHRRKRELVMTLE